MKNIRNLNEEYQIAKLRVSTFADPPRELMLSSDPRYQDMVENTIATFDKVLQKIERVFKCNIDKGDQLTLALDVRLLQDHKKQLIEDREDSSEACICFRMLAGVRIALQVYEAEYHLM